MQNLLIFLVSSFLITTASVAKIKFKKQKGCRVVVMSKKKIPKGTKIFFDDDGETAEGKVTKSKKGKTGVKLKKPCTKLSKRTKVSLDDVGDSMDDDSPDFADDGDDDSESSFNRTRESFSQYSLQAQVGTYAVKFNGNAFNGFLIGVSPFYNIKIGPQMIIAAGATVDFFSSSREEVSLSSLMIGGKGLFKYMDGPLNYVGGLSYSISVGGSTAAGALEVETDFSGFLLYGGAEYKIQDNLTIGSLLGFGSGSVTATTENDATLASLQFTGTMSF